MVEKAKHDTYTGFCLGFVTSLAMCGFYWLIMIHEQQVMIPMVEVYPKYSVPEPKGSSGADDILKYGAPDRGPETLVYTDHIVGYDQSRKIPLWVAEHITAEKHTGDANMANCSFGPSDTDQVQEVFSASLEDYEGSGHDKGQMSPEANHKYSQEAMCDSFYLTNVIPLDNQHYWREIEEHCRSLTGTFRDVRVISGPVFLTETWANTAKEKRFVRYEVLGKNNVNVPTHLYKVIMVENPTNSTNITLYSAAFLLPNEPIYLNVPLKSFQIPLIQLEAFTGLRFFPRLGAAPLGNLCQIDPCKLPGETDSLLQRFASGVSATVVYLAWAYSMYKWQESDSKK
ncbi:uncharacterized protein [Asterias amurensis]|uniref:uncharacterized protein n=1 Tax=Asterias amurensis TaxID=7602 RepID=UPI003AB5493C